MTLLKGRGFYRQPRQWKLGDETKEMDYLFTSCLDPSSTFGVRERKSTHSANASPVTDAVTAQAIHGGQAFGQPGTRLELTTDGALENTGLFPDA